MLSDLIETPLSYMVFLRDVNWCLFFSDLRCYTSFPLDRWTSHLIFVAALSLLLTGDFAGGERVGERMDRRASH